MQKLAHIVLKLDKVGSTVPKRYVTPAEVYFLVADHHERAGDDAIVRLTELADDAEEAPLRKAKIELKLLQEELDATGEDATLTDEIREKRTSATTRKMQIKEDVVAQLTQVIERRSFDSAKEKQRLAMFYGLKRVNALFPGQFPQLPDSFVSARDFGTKTTVPSERFLTVGDTGA